MPPKIRILPAAERDLDEIRAWLDRQRPGLANEFFDRFDELLKMVGQAPRAFRCVDLDIRAARLHQFRYRVFYRPVGNTLFIGAVLHTSRDPDIWRHRF